MKKNIIIFFSFLIPSTLNSLILHEYLVDLFQKEVVPLEYNIYKLLKNNLIEKDINYLVMPWSVLINEKKLNLVPDIKLDGGFTVCQHISYENIIPILKKIGINVLFTPHVNKVYGDFTVLPLPHLAINGAKPSFKKNIYYSFIGADTHISRKKIFQLRHPLNSVVIQRTEWHFYLKKKNLIKQEFEKKQYQDVLSRSIFSLCPRGTGASTLRFWESLKAGAIPVLIADDMQLPKNFNWKRCIIQIPEKNVTDINKILSTINLKKQNELRKNCLQAYNLFSDKNLASSIQDFYLKTMS